MPEESYFADTNREIRRYGIAVSRVANELLITENHRERAVRLSEAGQALVDLSEKLEKRRQQHALSLLPRGWVAIDADSGATDGVYADQNDAVAALERLKARFPAGVWHLFALHSSGNGEVVSEAMFWRNRLGVAAEPGQS